MTTPLAITDTTGSTGAAAAAPHRTTCSGLLRACWQLQRTPVLIGIAGAAVLIAALAGFRTWTALVRTDASAACFGGGSQTAACREVDYNVFSTLAFVFAVLQLACLVLAVGGGLLIGTAAFAREYEQRTQVFALTQPVRRIPWWAAKVLIALAPMTLSMLAVGGVAAWAFADFPFQDQPMGISQFYIPSDGLAVLYLFAASAAVTAGILTRSSLGGLLVAAALTALVATGGEAIRSDLAPADRSVQALDEYSLVNHTGWVVDNGWLNTDGQVVTEYTYCPLWDTITESTDFSEYEEIDRQCQAQAGIVNRYVDYIPTSRFWQIHLTWSAIVLTLSALVLAAGAVLIRRRAL